MSRAPGVVAKKALLARARRPMRHDFGADDTKPLWTGPVERRDPRHYQQRSVIAIWKCPNTACRHWASGDRCVQCQSRRPA